MKVKKSKKMSFATTSATLAIMGASALSGLVHADETTATDAKLEATAENKKETATTVETAKTAVAEATGQVEMAQAVTDHIQSEVTKQELKVEASKAAEEEAKETVDTLEANLEEYKAIAETATPETLAQLEQQVEEKTAEKEVAEAKEAAANEAVSTQEKTVATAETAKAEAQKVADESDKEVKAIETEIAAQSQVGQEKTKAEEALVTLDAQLQAAKRELETTKSEAKEQIEATIAAKTAEIEAKKAEIARLEADQTTQVTPAASVVGQNTLTLPAGFPSVVTAANMAANDAAIRTGMYSNEYKTIAEDTTEYINAANLTVTQQAELAQFVAELLNPIRQQLGLSEAIITTSAQELARRMSNQYNSQGSLSTHNFSAIYSNASEVGLRAGDDYAYEALGFSYGVPTTMNALKQNLYYSLKIMLFDDGASGYGHTLLLLRGDSTTPQYLGVSSSVVNYTLAGTQSAQQIYMIPETNVVSAAFSRTPLVATSATRVDHSAEITALNQAIQTLSSDVATLQAARGDIALHPSVVAAQERVTSASNSLTAKQEEVARLSEQLDQAIALSASQKEALLAAKEKANQAHGLLDEAAAKVTSETATLQQLRLEAAAAKASVDTLSEEIASLETLLDFLNDPEFITKAEAQLESAKAAYAGAKETLTADLAALEVLMEQLLVAKNTLAAKKADLVAAQEVLASLQSEIKSEEDKATTAPVVKDATTVQNGRDFGDVTAAKATSSQGLVQSLSKAIAKDNKTYQAGTYTDSNRLPETGEQDQKLASLLGFAMLSATAIGAYKRKKVEK